MLKVGLTGGYASGKTLVAKHLELLGCRVVYSDRLGHEVLLPCGEAYQPALALFGKGILAADGTIDRRRLASIVFSDSVLLDKLNSIVHPAVFRLEEAALKGVDGVAVIEAAILIETGRYKMMDKLIVTSCLQEIQIARAMKRDHITRDQAQARISRQLSNSERISVANYVIGTNGTIGETLEQTSRIYVELRQLAEVF